MITFFKPKRIIYRNDGSHYMYRWNLFECNLFSIKLHKIMLSDEGCMHDHPWAFITFLLKGGYVEYNRNGSRVYSRFSMLYRPAEYAHRLEIHQPVWSLVMTFKRKRKWGFLTKDGWVHWKKYIGDELC